MRLDESSREWDVIVVGAGIAGSAVSLRIARAGLRVLLVEKSRWPREKVCGGCLNALALRQLKACGMSDVALIGRAYNRMHLAVCARSVEFPLPEGRAMTRRRLDERLAARAVAEGACFLPATRAALGEVTERGREVWLKRQGKVRKITAALVLDCGGLAGHLSAADLPDQREEAMDSHIGLGTVIADAPAFYRPGAIHMACGKQGYVGLVRAEESKVNIGAALDPAWLKRMGGPARAIAALLDQADFPAFAALHTVRWHGTPRLTCRRRRLGAKRLFVLGDATGYVEPFTGEGMAWALADAAALAPLAQAAVGHWEDALAARWSARHRRIVGGRRRTCRVVARTLRHPRLVAAGLPLLAAAPALVTPLTAWLNHDFAIETTAWE
jgi:flavin-dependent dehydrogenase